MPLILAYKDKLPVIGKNVYLAPNATIIGDTTINDNSSIWFGCSIRGDSNYIKIGFNTNIQDLCIVHGTNETAPTIIGSNVTVGHNAVIHGGEIGDFCLIGIGSIILDNAVIEPYSMVAAGAVVKPKTVVKTKSLYAGIPAKAIRPLSDAELHHLEQSAKQYIDYKNQYL